MDGGESRRGDRRRTRRHKKGGVPPGDRTGVGHATRPQRGRQDLCCHGRQLRGRVRDGQGARRGRWQRRAHIPGPEARGPRGRHDQAQRIWSHLADRWPGPISAARPGLHCLGHRVRRPAGADHWRNPRAGAERRPDIAAVPMLRGRYRAHIPGKPPGQPDPGEPHRRRLGPGQCPGRGRYLVPRGQVLPTVGCRSIGPAHHGRRIRDVRILREL